ncbi:glycosyltransferase family 4 protein [Methylomonas sp. YC3]
MTQVIIATIMRPVGETGVQTHFNCFCDYLTQQKIPHQLVTPFSYYWFLVYPVFALRKIVGMLSSPLGVWWYRYWHAYFLERVLEHRLRSGFDCVIYAQCPLSANAAMKARSSVRQKVVLVVHFNVSQADEWMGKGVIQQSDRIYRSIRNFEEFVLPGLDGLVFVSRFMRQELVTRIPAIHGIPFIVAPNFLRDPGVPKPFKACSDLISIGTLEARKNQQYLLDIVSSLKDLGCPLRLTIVGDGPDSAMLQQKVKELNIEELVIFAGYIQGAAYQLSLHKACIHVATVENLPITLIESIARGRPIFVAPVGGIPEILGNQMIGVALPLDNAKTAAQLIAKAFNDSAWMTVASTAARELFLNEFSADVVARKLVNFLESC